MWKRSELKKKARTVFRKNYWTAVAVCFILAFFAGEYTITTSGIHQYDTTQEMKENVIDTAQMVILSEPMMIGQKLIENGKESLSFLTETINANLNGITQSQIYLQKFVDTYYQVVNQENIVKGLMLLIAGFANIAFIIFVINPLKVGGRRFFVKARQMNKTRIGEMGVCFHKKKFWNPVKVMFFRSLYTTLWYLTIVIGIIKTYEYSLIPYLLAEYPDLEKKKAFVLSKQMMKKNKWKTFVLDLSFIGWDILSVITFGLVGIFYKNSYHAATKAELYSTLKQKAIEEKYEFYEELK